MIKKSPPRNIHYSDSRMHSCQYLKHIRTPSYTLTCSLVLLSEQSILSRLAANLKKAEKCEIRSTRENERKKELMTDQTNWTDKQTSIWMHGVSESIQCQNDPFTSFPRQTTCNSNNSNYIMQMQFKCTCTQVRAFLRWATGSQAWFPPPTTKIKSP